MSHLNRQEAGRAWTGAACVNTFVQSSWEIHSHSPDVADEWKKTWRSLEKGSPLIWRPDYRWSEQEEEGQREV